MDFGVFMASAPSLLSLPQWPDFAGVVRASLTSLSRFQPSLQWLLAEPLDDQEARVLLCGGDGPLSDGIMLPRPAGRPQNLSGGTLTTLPLTTGQDASGPEGYLGIWRPQSAAETGSALALLDAKARLFSALLQELRRSSALMAELEQARMEAETDPLTGLLNRRGWNAQLAREEARCQRYGHTCTLIVIDLDALKQVNDGHGHCAGDRLIRQTGRLLTETIRQPDVVARIGGDEFAVLLVNTDSLHARGFEKRLGDALQHSGVRASTGKATWLPGESLQDTLCRADKAMYANKPVRQGTTP